MPRRLLRWSLVLLVGALASCEGSGSGGGTSFNAFVRQQLDGTADDTDPVPLEGLRFRFDEDPDAFDDLF